MTLKNMRLILGTVVALLVLLEPRDIGAFHDPNYFPNRDVMVHLFEWRWSDVAKECERFLAPMGYAGVQVSPPNENVVFDRPPFMPDVTRPWFERYQPVSYKLLTRSGNDEEFRDMVRRCNQVGIRIYVDAVLNHMTGIFPGSTNATGGSPFDSEKLVYDAVPYGPEDFHSSSICGTSDGEIQDYGNGDQVKNCRLVKLADLDQSRESVRQKMADFLNYLIEIGVAGFRIDAAKHMWPQDLDAIYRKLNNLSTEYFAAGTQPLIFQEVIQMEDGSVSGADYMQMGRVTEFKYGLKLGNVIRGNTELRYLQNFGEGWGLTPSDKALAFVDNHDNQRGHGGGGSDVLTFFDPEWYKKAVAFMLAWPYGLKRVMSSYRWDRNFVNGQDVNNWVGPPHDDQYNTLPVGIDDQDGCTGGWVCEHRWPIIAQMVRFSIVSGNRSVENWWDYGNFIAFSRGDRAFLAINNGDWMATEVPTGLAPGLYCDIATGIYMGHICTGRLATVQTNGRIYVNMGKSDPGIMALHAGTMMRTKDDMQASSGSPLKRTVVLIQVESKGSVFIRGGISNERRPACSDNEQLCKIGIRQRVAKERNLKFANSSVGNGQLGWDGFQMGTEMVTGAQLFQTSNDPKSDSYYDLNRYGANYWAMDVDMNCTQTDSGWFEFKVVQNANDWEPQIAQDTECTGDEYRALLPFRSNNHVAMCGKVNVFRYGSNACIMNNF